MQKRNKDSGSLLTLLSDFALESVLNKLGWSEPDNSLHQRASYNDLPVLVRGSLNEMSFEINGVYYQTTSKWIDKRDPKIKRKEEPQWITLK